MGLHPYREAFSVNGENYMAMNNLENNRGQTTISFLSDQNQDSFGK